MITRIKRTAQFLFDNADLIEQFLCKSDHFRSMSINLCAFRHDLPELQIELSLYDETSTHYYLQDDAIFKERFIQLCNTVNENSGVTELPKPIEVRNKLDSAEQKKM